MKKRIMIGFLGLALCVFFAGCTISADVPANDTPGPTPTAENTTTPTPEPTPTPTPTPEPTPEPTPTPTPESTPEPSDTETVAPSDEQPASETKVFSFSADDFKASFNDHMADLGSSNKLPAIEWVDGEAMASVQINELLGFLFTRSLDTDELESILFIGTGDGSTESGLEILYCMSSALMSADPSIAQTDTGEIILELLGDGSGGSKVINGIDYHVIQSEELGTWMTIIPE